MQGPCDSDGVFSYSPGQGRGQGGGRGRGIWTVFFLILLVGEGGVFFGTGSGFGVCCRDSVLGRERQARGKRGGHGERVVCLVILTVGAPLQQLYKGFSIHYTEARLNFYVHRYSFGDVFSFLSNILGICVLFKPRRVLC